MLRRLFTATLLSILLFFSTSFLTVLQQIPPIAAESTSRLKIGFPFVFYEQFQVRGNDFLNYGWNPDHLLLDCSLTWILTTIIYITIKRKN